MHTGSDAFDSIRSVPEQGQEHPHDTEDLVRLVTLVRHEQNWTRSEVAAAAGVSEAVVAQFEAQQVVPAQSLSMRFLEAMGRR